MWKKAGRSRGWTSAGRTSAGRTSEYLKQLRARGVFRSREGRAFFRMGSFSEENVLTYIPDQGEKEMLASAGLPRENCGFL